MIDGQKMVCAFRASLVLASSGKTLLNCWLQKGRFPRIASNLIAWEVQGTAAKTIGSIRHQCLVKMASGRGPIGVEMVLRKEWKSAQCPQCTEPFETYPHLLRCPVSVSTWATSQTLLQHWLLGTTSPGITSLDEC